MPVGSAAPWTIWLALVAPSGPLEVEWKAPAECSSAAKLRESIDRYAHGQLHHRAGLRARAEVTQEPAHYRLELTLDVGDNRTRFELTDPDCELLADAAALKIAMAWTELGTTETATGSEPPARKSEAPPRPSPSGPPEATSKPMPSCRPGKSALAESAPGSRRLAPRCGALSVDAMGQLGPLPDDVGAGVGGRFFVLWPRVAVTLGVHHWFARSQAIAPASDLRAEISLTAAQLSGCARLGVATVEFPLCTGIELGALVGRSLQIEEPGADRLLWGAWLAQAGIGWSPLRRFAAHIDLGMIVPLRRYRFAVDNIGTVFEPAPVGLRFGGSVAIRFP